MPLIGEKPLRTEPREMLDSMKQTNRIFAAMLAPMLAMAFFAVSGGSQTTASICDGCESKPIACGTEMPAVSEVAALELAAAEFEPVPPAIVTTPVYFHIITDASGAGDVSDAALIQQIAVMNAAFSGGQATGAANTDFRFSHAGTDRTVNTAWYTAGINSADEVAMKTALHRGSADDLNIYIKLSDVGGYATFPWGYAAKPLEDGIVCPASALPGGTYSGEGMVHEAGHWLGLYHTFQGGCSQNNDFVSDTPAEREPNRQCPAPNNLDTCTGGQYKGKDPTNNFMDYTPEACRDRFTAGQSARMNLMYSAHRAGK